MAVILLDIEGRDNSSGALDRANRGLANLDQTMGRLSGSSTTVQRAMQAQEASYLRLDSSLLRVQTATDRSEAAQRKAASAADAHRQALAGLATATGDVSGAMSRVDATYTRAISSQERAVSSANALKGAYNQLSRAQLDVAASGTRMDAVLNQTPRSSGGGGFSIPGGGFVRGAVAGAGATAGYYALSAAGTAFSNDLAYQRQTGVNAATTDVGTLTPAQRQAIDSYVTGLAGGGTQQYGKLTLAQGLAPIEGATTDLGAIKAVNQAGYMGSTITGSTDTLTMNQTLTQILGSYGIRDPKQMGAQAMGYEDVIQNMINKGLVQPNQVAGSIPTFSGYAASVGMSFQSAGGIFGALTNYTKDPQMAAQQERALIADVTSGPMRNKGQRAAIQAAGLGDYFGPDALKMDPTKWLTGVESHIARDPGRYLPLLFPNQDALAGMQNLVGQGGANMGTSTGIFAAMGRTGTTQAGFEQYQQSPVAKFDNASTQFNTAVGTFSEAMTPFLTGALALGANALKDAGSVFAGPGGKGGFGASWDAADRVLRAYVNPLGPDFMNMDKARADVGRQIQQERAAAQTTAASIAPERTAAASGMGPQPGNAGDYYSGFYATYAARHHLTAAQIGGTPPPLPNAGPEVSSRGVPANTVLGSNPDYAQLDLLASGDKAAASGRYLPGGIGGGIGRSAGGIGGALSWALPLIALGANPPKSGEGPTAGGSGQGEAVGRGPDPKILMNQRVAGDQLALTAAQQNLDAARMMGATPDALNRINHAFLDEQRAVYKDTLTGSALSSALRGVDKQQAAGDYATRLADTQTARRSMSNQEQIDTIHGNLAGAAKDRAAELAYNTKNAKILGLSPSDLALEAAQNWQANQATNVPTPAPFHANQQGLGAFGAGDMSTLVRLGGGKDPQAETIRTLREQLAKDEQMIVLLQAIVNQGRAGNTARSTGMMTQRGHQR